MANVYVEIRMATHINIVGQDRSNKMASAVVKQPTSSKSEQEDTKTSNKILPDDNSLNKMDPDEKKLDKILPGKRFLRRKESPTSDAVVKLLDGVDGGCRDRHGQLDMLRAWLCSCCKVGCL